MPEEPALASGAARSILIGDDRADVRVELAKILLVGSPGPVHVQAVADGFARLDVYPGNS